MNRFISFSFLLQPRSWKTYEGGKGKNTGDDAQSAELPYAGKKKREMGNELRLASFRTNAERGASKPMQSKQHK
jgi:hypothetical protein